MPIPASANFVFSVASVLIPISFFQLLTSPPATPPLASQLSRRCHRSGHGWLKTSGHHCAGHLMYLEKPEEFSRVFITFIDRNGP